MAAPIEDRSSEDATGAGPPGVVLLTDDLLFGSKVESMIRGAGAVPLLVSAPADATRVSRESSAVLLIVDLVSDGFDGIGVAARADGVPLLGYYAHTDDDVRRRAIASGFTQVVPRSRMAREGQSLIKSLISP
ncbi:MAG: hypothetical protein HY827_01615 [Actinobacteria bacterium]|nr:hypothetical protein [Actinomycetota bacterium]